VPEPPGEYLLTYRYGAVRATAPYTVVPARLEADITARVRDLMFSDNPNLVPPKPVAMYVHVLSLRSDGTSYICVQQDSVAHPDPIGDPSAVARHPEFDHEHVSTFLATPFKRVATSGEAVISISATADSEENLRIEWTDATGKTGSLFYPASYPARKQ